MRQCPKCGKKENEIEQTTMGVFPDENKAWCPCGWHGKVGDLVTNFGKSPDEWRAELDAREKAIEEREKALEKEEAPAPRSLGEIVTDIMPYLSEEGQVYLSENDAAWKSGEIPQGIVVENFPDTGLPPVESMNKKQLVEALTALGVEFDPKAKRDDLLAVYMDALANKQLTDEEKEPDQEADIADAEDEQPTV